MALVITAGDENTRKNYEYIRTYLLRVGTVVRPKHHIGFSDGTSHNPWQTVVVTEETMSYYVVNFSSYVVVRY